MSDYVFYISEYISNTLKAKDVLIGKWPLMLLFISSTCFKQENFLMVRYVIFIRASH